MQNPRGRDRDAQLTQMGVKMKECSLFLTSLLRPLGIHQCRGVVVGEESHQVRCLLQGLEALLDLRNQAIGDMLGEHNLAGGRSRIRSGSHLCERKGMYQSNRVVSQYSTDGGLWRRGMEEILGRKRLCSLIDKSMPAFGPSLPLQTATMPASSHPPRKPVSQLSRSLETRDYDMILSSSVTKLC